MSVDTLTPTINHTDLVLGAMLTTPRCIDDIADIIHGGDLPDARDETIFDAIIGQHTAGQPVNLIAISDRLQASGDLARIGGTSRLATLTNAAALPSAATWHAERIRDASVLNAVRSTGLKLQTLTEQTAPDTDAVIDVVNDARTHLDALITADTKDIPNHIAVYDAITALDEPPGHPTPWPSITRAIAGWKPGAMYVVGARPAVGKSLFAQAIVLDAARRGQTALFFSLEMSKRDVYWRMLSSVGGVDMARIQQRELTASDHSRMREAADTIAALPLVVDDRADMSVAQIRNRVRAEKRKRDIGVVVIDYLGLVRPPASSGKQDRRVQVDAISRSIKLLSKDLEVPVVALAQLNRGLEQRATKEPTLSDLRESGAIEQDADVVMLLHRDPHDRELGTTMGVLIAKNRHGPQAKIELAFQGHKSTISEATY